MRLLATSDLHVGFRPNREALEALPQHGSDWLIVAGDVGESEAHLHYTLKVLTARFDKVIWVPGNHELWIDSSDPERLRGIRKYDRLVSICRSYGVLTPEDPYPVWPGEGPPRVIAPVFLLYDYSFRPDHVAEAEVLAWAQESGVFPADEILLQPDPYPTRQALCAARCEATAQRLALIPPEYSVILVNHYPLRREMAVLPAVPRYSPWCGTRLTEDWHRRFRVEVVVFGHLHIRSSRIVDGVRFEEVSIGYPRQWDPQRGMERYLRQILPAN
jgi:3',5'-cyclic AMP phosphodiesterase CpdA